MQIFQIRNFKSILSIVVVALLLFSGCGKDKTTEPDQTPEQELTSATVETTGLSFKTPISVEFTGKIINDGKHKIMDHGFIYVFGSEEDLTKGIKISLGADAASGIFTARLNEVQFPVKDGMHTELVVEAYVTDDKGTQFGKALSTYKGGLRGDLSPYAGISGDIVTISGNFIGLKAGEFKVTFGGVNARIIGFTETSITVEVPSGIPAGHGEQVAVKLQVGTVSGDMQKFIIWANIKDINPKYGPIGTKIHLTGDNLPRMTSQKMAIVFGDALAPQYYDTEFFIRVPSGTPDEKVRLHYFRGNQPVELPFEFMVTPPVIKSITPNPALITEPITIRMDNFEPFLGAEGDPSVSIGDIRTLIRANEKGELVFRPLGDFKTGQNYTVTVTIGPHTVTAPEPLVFK